MREKLEQAGLRVTRQRMMIANLLFAKGDRHVTAEALYAESSVIPYPPSLATIYNTLRDFADKGLVREIALYGGKVWFDTQTGPHFHFYLEDREELFDIPESLIPTFNIPAPAGMRIAGIDVVIKLERLPEGMSLDAPDTAATSPNP
jgi:Fur family iron response transcriptional regulator